MVVLDGGTGKGPAGRLSTPGKAGPRQPDDLARGGEPLDSNCSPQPVRPARARFPIGRWIDGKRVAAPCSTSVPKAIPKRPLQLWTRLLRWDFVMPGALKRPAQ